MVAKTLLLDACVAINLIAAGPIDQIALDTGHLFLITQQAAAEIGHLRNIQIDHEDVIKINLPSFVKSGVFEITELTADEVPMYVDLAADIDDGEASTIAVASRRGLPLATDDRKARRVCAKLGLPMPTGTAALIRDYCEACAMDKEELAVILGRVTSLASFHPPRSDPDAKWWAENLRNAVAL